LNVPLPVTLSSVLVVALTGDAPSRNVPTFVSVVLAPMVSVLAVVADVLPTSMLVTVEFEFTTSAFPVLPVLPSCSGPVLEKAVLIVCTIPPPELTATAPVKFRLLPLSVKAAAPELNVMPAKVVPAAKSLFNDVTLEAPKMSESPGSAVYGAPVVVQFGAFQKLPAGAALQVALDAPAGRVNPTAAAAAAARRIVRFVAAIRPVRKSVCCISSPRVLLIRDSRPRSTSVPRAAFRPPPVACSPGRR